MQNKIAVGISIDKNILEKIDEERGDIPRSRYIAKKIEQLEIKKIKTIGNESHATISNNEVSNI